MALDTYQQLWNRVLLRCPAASSFLARDWITNAFRQLSERRRWSWLLKFGQFIAPPLYREGLVNVTREYSIVTGSGTAWTSEMIGRQFRIGGNTPIYTIVSVDTPTQLTLDAMWGGQSLTGSTYEIYQCFFTPPDDFSSFVSVWDPAMSWQLWLHVTQQEINVWDAQRSSRGQVYCVASRDYTRSQVGVVAPVFKAAGSAAGPSPVSGGTYTGPHDAMFVVTCTSSGSNTAAVYSWRKDNGPLTAGATAGGEFPPQDLQDGVQIHWPAGGGDYLSGTTWIIRAKAGQAPGIPRYELWPHQTSAYVYPFLYESHPADLGDPGAVLPHPVRGDILVEAALAEAARWPGPSIDKPNPYFSLRLSEAHQSRAERMMLDLEIADDNIYQQDLSYQVPLGYPYATPLGDASWLQSHAI